jgi:uncharacterized membrane protein
VAPVTPVPLPDLLYFSLWLFFLYSFAGVVVEALWCWAVEHKGVVESRAGILYLPFNPLYGIGGVAITLAVVEHFRQPLAVFGIGLLVGTVLEYVTSLVMEKLFHTVFWDYSDKVLNIHGRVCLQYAIYWGLLSLVLLYVFDLVNVLVIRLIPRELGWAIVALLVVATLFSIVVTLAAYVRYEHRTAALRAGTAPPDTPGGRLVDRLVPPRLFVNTFPRMSISTEFQEVSGIERRWIRWTPKIGRPSERHTEMRDRQERLAH